MYATECELVQCDFCDRDVDESEIASCETISMTICADCHPKECDNINLCEMAGNF